MTCDDDQPPITARASARAGRAGTPYGKAKTMAIRQDPNRRSTVFSAGHCRVWRAIRSYVGAVKGSDALACAARSAATQRVAVHRTRRGRRRGAT